MSENTFWTFFNAIIGATIIAVVYLSTDYWKDQDGKIVELIGTGVDPVAAICAMQDDYGKMPVCVILATKGTDNQ